VFIRHDEQQVGRFHDVSPHSLRATIAEARCGVEQGGNSMDTRLAAARASAIKGAVLTKE